MGRSTYNSIVLGPYLVVPFSPVDVDPTAGVTTIFKDAPAALASTGFTFYTSDVSAHNEPNQEVHAIGARAGFRIPPKVAHLQGALWSFTQSVSAPSLLDFLTAGMGGYDRLTAQIPVPVGVNVSGYVGGSQAGTGGSATPALASWTDTTGSTGLRSQSASQGIFGQAILSGAQNLLGHGFAAIVSPRNFFDGSSLFFDAIPGRLSTRHAGCTTGFYVNIPLHDVDVTTGLTDTQVRQITIPFSMRVESIVFYTGASAAGNTVKVRNLTQAVDITPVTAITSATPAAVEVIAANLTNRNLAQGDVIDLQVTTGATGITTLGATICGYVTGHLNAKASDDIQPDINPGTSYVAKSGTTYGRTHHSGPCQGGLSAFLMGRGVVGTGQTNAVVSRMIAQYDFTVGEVRFYSLSSAAGNSVELFNETKNVSLGTLALTGSTLLVPTFAVSNGLVNTEVAKGDVIALRATTGATAGFGKLGASLIVHVRGHVNANPAYD